MVSFPELFGRNGLLFTKFVGLGDTGGLLFVE